MVRTVREIELEIQDADDIIDNGESKFFGLPYEAGVKAALEWVLGWVDERPLED
jgi:hypothetical protein